MIIYLFSLVIILMFLLTYFIISKIIKFDNSIKKLNIDIYIFEQKLLITTDKIKRLFVKKTKKKNNNFYYEIFKGVLDISFIIIFKKRYEKLKDLYDFIKATIA